MSLKNLLVLLLVLSILSSISSFVIAEEDDDDHDDDHKDRVSDSQEIITIYEEVPADNTEILEALDLMVQELTNVETQLSEQNRTISQLRSEIAILKFENNILRQKQAELSANSKYFNSSISHIVSTFKDQDFVGGRNNPVGDDDGDGVLNANDMYPGQNDFMKLDSDNDGISDYNDLFPGENDLYYQDIDGDGVRDSEDSNLNVDTDLDKDGIDDLYDDRDDSPLIVRTFRWLGFI